MAAQAMTAPGTKPGFFQGGIAAAREAMERLKNRAAETREELKSKEIELSRANGVISEMMARMPKVMGPVLTTGATMGAAYGAGYLQELLDEKKSGKIGPVDAVPALGFALAAGAAMFIKDPDVAAGVISVGVGAAAGGAGEAGRAKRKAHKAALDAQKATAKAA